MKRLVGLLLLLSLLCACTAQQAAQPEPVQAPETEAAPTAAVTIAVENGAGFDPYDCRSALNRLLLEFVYEPLFTVSAAGEPEAVLAERWSVSEDGRTTTVRLRTDVKLHNGKPLTAEDVVRSVSRAAGSAYYGERFRLLERVSADGNQLVVFQTEQPYECFPLLLDIPISGETADSETVCGTGAYTLAGTKLVRFSDWHGDAPLPDTIGLYPVQSLQALREGFEFGRLTLTMQDPNGNRPLWLAGDYEAWDVPTSTLQYLGFNLQGGVFASGGVRAAVTYAVDRAAIVAADMGGCGVPTPLTVRPGTSGYSAVLADSVTYEPSRLKDAAPKGAQAVLLVCSESEQRVKTANRIADALSDCGVETTVRALGQKAFSEALAAGAFDLYLGELRLSPDLDAAAILRTGYGGVGAFASLFELCNAARENSGNAYDLQKTILTDGILCPIAYKTETVYAKRGLPVTITPHLNGWILG